MPYTTAGERQVVLQTLQKRKGFCSVDEASLLACCLFTVSEEGGIVGGFLRQARETLRNDSAEQQQWLPWTTTMLSYIEGMPVPASKCVYKLMRSKAWFGPKTKLGGKVFVLSGEFWNAFADPKAMHGFSDGTFEALVVVDAPAGFPWAACTRMAKVFQIEADFVVVPYALAACTQPDTDASEFGLEGVTVAKYLRLLDVKDPGAHILHGLTVTEG